MLSDVLTPLAVSKRKEHQHKSNELETGRSLEAHALRQESKRSSKSKGGGPREDQLSFYHGELRLVIEYGCAFIRIFLATVNAFPSTREMVDLPVKYFKMGCERVKKTTSSEGMSLYLSY